MKKLFLVLTLLILTAGMSYAGPATIGIVKSFSGQIMLQRGTNQAVQIYEGLELYPDDELWFQTSATNDYVVLSNECLPNFPTVTIRRTDVPSPTQPIYWNASNNLLELIKNGGDGSILIGGKEGIIPPILPRPEVER